MTLLEKAWEEREEKVYKEMFGDLGGNKGTGTRGRV
jgi:hypothetical protein